MNTKFLKIVILLTPGLTFLANCLVWFLTNYFNNLFFQMFKISLMLKFLLVSANYLFLALLWPLLTFQNLLNDVSYDCLMTMLLITNSCHNHKKLLNCRGADFNNIIKTLHCNTHMKCERFIHYLIEKEKLDENLHMLPLCSRLPAQALSCPNYEQIGYVILSSPRKKLPDILRRLSTNAGTVDRLLASSVKARGSPLIFLRKLWIKIHKAPHKGVTAPIKLFLASHVGRCVVAGSLRYYVGNPILNNDRRKWNSYCLYGEKDSFLIPFSLTTCVPRKENVIKIARSIFWNPLKSNFLLGTFKACRLLHAVMNDSVERNNIFNPRRLYADEARAYLLAKKSYQLVLSTTRASASSRPLFLDKGSGTVEFARNKGSWYWKRFFGHSFGDYIRFFNSTECWPSDMYLGILRHLIYEACILSKAFPSMENMLNVYMRAYELEQESQRIVKLFTIPGFSYEPQHVKPAMAFSSRAKKRRYRRNITAVVSLWRFIDRYRVRGAFSKIFFMAVDSSLKLRRRRRSVVRRFDNRQALMGAIRLLREHGFTLREIFYYMTSLDRPTTAGLLTGLISPSTKPNAKIGPREDELLFSYWAHSRSLYLDKEGFAKGFAPREYLGTQFDMRFMRDCNPMVFARKFLRHWEDANFLLKSEHITPPRGYPVWPDVKGFNIQDLKFYIRACPELMKPEWMKVLNELVRRKKNPLPVELVNGKRPRPAPKPRKPKLFPGKRTLVGTDRPEWYKENWPLSYIPKYKLILPEESPVNKNSIVYRRGSMLPFRPASMLGPIEHTSVRSFPGGRRKFSTSRLLRLLPKKKVAVYVENKKQLPEAASGRAGRKDGGSDSSDFSSSEEETSLSEDAKDGSWRAIFVDEDGVKRKIRLRRVGGPALDSPSPRELGEADKWSPGRFAHLRNKSWKRRGKYIAESRKKYPRGFKWPASEIDMEPTLFAAAVNKDLLSKKIISVIDNQTLKAYKANKNLKKNIKLRTNSRSCAGGKLNSSKKLSKRRPVPRKALVSSNETPVSKIKDRRGGKKQITGVDGRMSNPALNTSTIRPTGTTATSRNNPSLETIKRNFSTGRKLPAADSPAGSHQKRNLGNKKWIPPKWKNRKKRFFRPKSFNRNNAKFRAGNIRKPLPEGAAPQRYSIRQKQRRFNKNKIASTKTLRIWVGGFRRVPFNDAKLRAAIKHPRALGINRVLRRDIRSVFYHKKVFDWNGNWTPTKHRPLLSSKLGSASRLGFRHWDRRDPRPLSKRIVLIKKSERDFISQWRWFAKAGLLPADTNLRVWRRPDDYRPIRYKFWTTQSFVVRQLRWALFWDDLLGLIKLRDANKKFSHQPQVAKWWNGLDEINFGNLGVLFKCREVLCFLAKGQLYLNTVIGFRRANGRLIPVSFDKKMEIIFNIQALALFYLGEKQTSNLLALIRMLEEERVKRNADVADEHSEIGHFLVLWAFTSEKSPESLGAKTAADRHILDVLVHLNKIKFWEQPRKDMLLLVTHKLPSWLQASALSPWIKNMLFFRFKTLFRRVYNLVSQRRRAIKKEQVNVLPTRSPRLYKKLVLRANQARRPFLLSAKKKNLSKFLHASAQAYSSFGLSQFTAMVGELSLAPHNVLREGRLKPFIFASFDGDIGLDSLYASRKLFSTLELSSRRFFRRKLALSHSKRYLPFINNIRPTYIDYENPYFSVGSPRKPVVIPQIYRLSIESLTEYNNRKLLLLKMPAANLLEFMAFAAINLSDDVNNWKQFLHRGLDSFWTRKLFYRLFYRWVREARYKICLDPNSKNLFKYLRSNITRVSSARRKAKSKPLLEKFPRPVILSRDYSKLPANVAKLHKKNEKFFFRVVAAGESLRRRVSSLVPTDHSGVIPVEDVMPSNLQGHSFWVDRSLSHYESFSAESEIDFIYTSLFAQQKKEITKIIIRDRKTGGKFDRIPGKYGYHQTRADPVGRSFILDKFINVFSKGGDRKKIREMFYNMLRRLDLCPSVFYWIVTRLRLRQLNLPARTGRVFYKAPIPASDTKSIMKAVRFFKKAVLKRSEETLEEKIEFEILDYLFYWGYSNADYDEYLKETDKGLHMKHFRTKRKY